MRGLTGTQVATFVDGMRTFGGGPARMDTPLSHTDPASVQRMDVVRGPYALAQGPSLSSIRVDTRPAIPNTPLTGTLRTGFASNHDAVDASGRVLDRHGPPAAGRGAGLWLSDAASHEQRRQAHGAARPQPDAAVSTAHQ